MEKVTGYNSRSCLYIDANDNLYASHGPKRGQVYLKCHTPECRGTATYYPTREIVVFREPHGPHENHHEQIVRLRFRDAIRQRVVECPSDAPKQIFEYLQLLHPEAANLVPFNAVRGLIATTRRTIYPPIPSNINELAEYFGDERYVIHFIL